MFGFDWRQAPRVRSDSANTEAHTSSSEGTVTAGETADPAQKEEQRKGMGSVRWCWIDCSCIIHLAVH